MWTGACGGSGPTAYPGVGEPMTMRVWIDQDLCTGDGLCVDHCPDVFVLLDDGISYVHDGDRIGKEPGGAQFTVAVPSVHEAAVIHAAEICPGECIFIEDSEP
jgi:ferredoxin